MTKIFTNSQILYTPYLFMYSKWRKIAWSNVSFLFETTSLQPSTGFQTGHPDAKCEVF